MKAIDALENSRSLIAEYADDVDERISRQIKWLKEAAANLDGEHLGNVIDIERYARAILQDVKVLKAYENALSIVQELKDEAEEE